MTTVDRRKFLAGAGAAGSAGLLGSVATRVVSMAPRPVLTVRGG